MAWELGGGGHGGSALVRPEREREPGRAREGANSELVMPGQLGHLVLEAQGAGWCVAMEVGGSAVHGCHDALSTNTWSVSRCST